MNRKLVIVLAALGILVLGVAIMFFLFSLKKEPQKSVKPQADIYVKAETVDYKNLQAVITSSGRLHAFNEVVVSAEVSGRLEEGAVPFRNGQTFSRGQVIARVDNPEFPLSVKARKSSFLQTLAAILPDIKLDYPDSYPNWQTFFDKIDINKPMPELPEPASSKERIFLASRNVLSSYYTILGDEARLEKYQIRAPFSGAFNSIARDPGVVVNPGTQLATIVRTDLYELEVPVVMEEVKMLEVGDSVSVSAENIDQTWKGKISRIGSVVNPSSQSVSVFISVPGVRGLYDGMYLTARLYGNMLENVMEMPRNSVFTQNHVYILEDKTLVEKTIDVVKRNPETVYFRGLTPGDELIVEPLLNVTGNPNYKKLR
ncbi:efflux RND transporter periplasmic adaptor subunit [Marinilabilia sp.]|jgi:multidrug efflux pump subunit AcrA (membrane-fusion protein)